MALPTLPSLTDSVQLQRRSFTQNIMDPFAPSGNGWGFEPTGGWGSDGYSGGGGSSFFIGGGSGGGGDTGGSSTGIPGGLQIGWNGIPTPGSGKGGTTGVGVTGANAQAAAGNSFWSGLFPAINWGRIAAFLLGLLLIAFGLYLIKGIQQSVNVAVVKGARAVAEGVAE